MDISTRNGWIILLQVVTSSLGVSMAMIISSLAVLDYEDPELILSAIRIVPYIAILAFGVIGGVYADLHNRRNIQITCDYISALTFFVSIWFVDGVYGYIAILFYVTANNLLWQFSGPAWRALMPEVIEKSQIPQLNSRLSSLASLVSTFTPILSLPIYHWIGLTGALTFVGVTQVLVGTLSFKLRYLDPIEQERKMNELKANTGPVFKKYLKGSVEGFVAVKKSRSLAELIIIFSLVCGMYSGIFYLMPLLPQIFDDPDLDAKKAYSYSISALAIGGLIGSLIYSHIYKRNKKRREIINTQIPEIEPAPLDSETKLEAKLAQAEVKAQLEPDDKLAYLKPEQEVLALENAPTILPKILPLIFAVSISVCLLATYPLHRSIWIFCFIIVIFMALDICVEIIASSYIQIYVDSHYVARISQLINVIVCLARVIGVSLFTFFVVNLKLSGATLFLIGGFSNLISCTYFYFYLRKLKKQSNYLVARV